MQIENMIFLGHMIVRLITPSDLQPLITGLATLGFGMTRIEGSGSFSHIVAIIFRSSPGQNSGGCRACCQHTILIFSLPEKMCVTSGKRQRSSTRMQKRRIPGFFGL